MKDFLIVGSGLAGTVLALELVKKSKNISIISNSQLPSSSQVAGGLINPVTGKFLGKTWLVEELFEELNHFYSDLEAQFNESFYHKTGLFRPFTSEEHKKSSLAQIEKHSLQDFIKVVAESEEYNEFYNANLGGMFSPDAGWLDLPKFLSLSHTFLKNKVEWIDESFNFSDLKIIEDSVIYKSQEAKKVIFCEGFYVKDNPYFKWLPMNPVKGETILGEVENYNIKSIVNQGKWLIPLEGNKVRLGATYSWHELDFLPTEKGKNDLLEVTEKILKKSLKITGQQAGVRPATKDRRPILGQHPEFKSLYIFNGLGTKGVSLAPYFAKQLVGNLLQNEVIHPEVNIERFLSLYS